jgi:hypothetical protein
MQAAYNDVMLNVDIYKHKNYTILDLQSVHQKSGFVMKNNDLHAFYGLL